VDELIAQAATNIGSTPAMVLRSAEARAKADGVTVEDVLAAWAGGGEIVAGSGAGAEAAAPSADAPVAEAPSAGVAATAPAPVAAQEVEVEVVEAEPAPQQSEPEPEPELEPVAKSSTGVPRWLAATFIIVPTIAFIYAVFLPNGPGCGDGAQLAVDPESGIVSNCDGSRFGAEQVNFRAMGEEVYQQCAACHGGTGLGAGNFPPLAGGAVLATFPESQCGDHVEWVALGSLGWPEATYGATNTPVGASGAQMPGFGVSLTQEELLAVVIFERVEFGGQDLNSALVDCGAAAPDGEPLEAASE